MTLRHTAYDRFKSQLFAGQIPPGAFLSQREICETLDMPLGPVREALKALEVEGLVTLINKRGVRVQDLDHEEFTKALDACKLIGGFAAANFAAQPQTPEGVSRDSALFALLDHMVQTLGNPALSAGYRKAADYIALYMSVFHLPQPSDLAPVHAALRAQNSRAARDAVLGCLDTLKQQITPRTHPRIQ